MEILILASGSKGNATIIKSGKQKILIDIGISFLNLNKKLIEENISVNNLDALFITHEHQDHIKGLNTLLKKAIIKNIFISKGTYNSLPLDVRKLFPINTIFIEAEKSFTYGDIEVTPFSLSHDAAEPISYIFNSNNKKAVVLTDTGYVDQSYFKILKNADAYILEANHDAEMLMNSKRPFNLKRRIISEKGHLGNNEASWLINEFIKEREKSVVWAVAHISEDCNTTYKIEESIVKIVEDPTKLEVIYTSQETSRKIEL